MSGTLVDTHARPVRDTTAPPVPNDAALLQQTAAGDREALAALYQRHSKALYNYLLRLTTREAAAEDLLQEVFIAAWQGASTFEGRSKVTTWLFQIAHHKAVSWLRSHRETTDLEDVVLPAPEHSPEALSLQTQQISDLQQALEQLSPEHRAVVELAFLHELPYKEIAQIMDCPVGTVKSRMAYALRRLNGLLQRQQFD